MKNTSKLEKNLGVKFKDKQLIAQALVHRSYINEHPSFELDHNERLEFLGDAVLELIVTQHLYKNYPNPEGDLTNWRASLVNSVNLAKTAEDLGIEPFLYLSRGENKDANSKGRQYILANAMEAVIGAVYLDSGMAVTKKFIEKTIISQLEEILKNKLHIDAKSYFQEMSQEKLGETPTYKVLESSGPDHAKTFIIGAYIADRLIAKGTGSSKQEGQTDAAEKSLAKKKWEVK